MFEQRSAVVGDPPQQALADKISNASGQITIVVGAPGLGQLETVRMVFAHVGAEVIEAEGNWHAFGYLAGFDQLITELVDWAESNAPSLVTRYEQTLKRIFPTRASSCFRVPKDLTNCADRQERTRFYHHEYQNKLLVGLAEFITEGLRVRKQSIVLTIDNANRLSRTSKNLISIIARKDNSELSIRFVLMDWDGSLFFPEAKAVAATPYGVEEFERHLNLGGYPQDQRELLYSLSAGNLAMGRALHTCMAAGIRLTRSMAPHSIVDLYLSSLDMNTKRELALQFLGGDRGMDFVAKRSAETLQSESLDIEVVRLHAAAMRQYHSGVRPLQASYAIAISDRKRQLEALVDICEILMEIGLYDTWFDLFSAHFNDDQLRFSVDCNSRSAGLFINAAFVLYAMGSSVAATPFLEEFLQRFPLSRFVPTALYAQSMIYGRYQIPIDLERAEVCAVRNLEQIEKHFSEHTKFKYIRVFAENAYAYIKARQGKFSEALEICERGNLEIISEYGRSLFLLHRSILIYNTSQVYEFVGDYQMAEAKLKAAIELDPYYGEYHNDLGNMLSKAAGRESEALMAYTRAIDLSPPYYEAHLNRGKLLAELGETDSAMKDFERVLEIKPAEWRALREIGNIKITSGENRSALGLYLKALSYEQNDADLNANTGLAYSELGERRIAIEYFRRAISLNPKHAEAHNNLAIDLLNDGEPAEALRHVKYACEYGSDPSYLSNLAEIQRILAYQDCAIKNTES